MYIIEEIKKLKALFEEGAISEEEFSMLKKKLISQGTNSAEPQKTSPTSSQIDPNIAEKESIEVKLLGKDAEESAENPDRLNYAKDDSSIKLDITKKEALKMLDKMNVGFDQQNLIYYAQVGDYKKVELLLIGGLSPNETWYNPEQKRNIYPLHNTAGWGTPKMVKLLLIYGAEINLEDENGFSALFYAIEYGTKAATKVLIDGGADINHKTKKRINPLYYAKMKKKPEMVELLTKSGAEEMPVNEIILIRRKKLLKNLLIAAAVIGICWFVGNAIFSPSSSSSSSSSESSTDDRAVLHCIWCKKVIYEQGHEGIICYTNEPDGCGVVQFYSGVKYAFCSVRCCELYRSIK